MSRGSSRRGLQTFQEQALAEPPQIETTARGTLARKCPGRCDRHHSRDGRLRLPTGGSAPSAPPLVQIGTASGNCRPDAVLQGARPRPDSIPGRAGAIYPPRCRSAFHRAVPAVTRRPPALWVQLDLRDQARCDAISVAVSPGTRGRPNTTAQPRRPSRGRTTAAEISHSRQPVDY
jgi:hypothetical protein